MRISLSPHFFIYQVFFKDTDLLGQFAGKKLHAIFILLLKNTRNLNINKSPTALDKYY